LSAIAGLSGTSEEPTDVVKASGVEPPTHDVAERRQLTVMFCDLVGSTALAARLDPEDMRGVIAAYHKCCSTLIAGNGGFAGASRMLRSGGRPQLIPGAAASDHTARMKSSSLGEALHQSLRDGARNIGRLIPLRFV
jgi:class 3 adenylate cyclase